MAKKRNEDLDANHPPGDPEAVYCGLCGTGRARVNGLMLCPSCDRGALVTAKQERPDAPAPEGK